VRRAKQARPTHSNYSLLQVTSLKQARSRVLVLLAQPTDANAILQTARSVVFGFCANALQAKIVAYILTNV